MNEAGDTGEFKPPNTALMDAAFWGTAHSVGFVLPLVAAWLTTIALAGFATVVCALLLAAIAVWWAWEFEDWWDEFKATNRALFLGLPAALLTPTLGLVVGANLR